MWLCYTFYLRTVSQDGPATSGYEEMIIQFNSIGSLRNHEGDAEDKEV